MFEIFTPDLFVALGFFLFVMFMISRDHTRDHERRIMERREFGPETKLARDKRKIFRSRQSKGD